MIATERDLSNWAINTTPSEFFRAQSRETRRQWYGRSNIYIAAQTPAEADFLSSNDPKFLKYIKDVQGLGWKVFGTSVVLHAFAHVIERDGLNIPFEGELKMGQDFVQTPNRNQISKDRMKFFNGTVGHLDFDVSGDSFKVYDTSLGKKEDITEQVTTVDAKRKQKVDEISEYPFFATQITKQVKKITADQKGMLVILFGTHSKEKGPTVVIQKDPADKYMEKTADAAIPADANVGLRTLRAASEHTQLAATQSNLSNLVREGVIPVSPAITRSKWVDYGLMAHIKKQIAQAVGTYVKNTGLQCDPLDLQYQVVFRLTAFKISELFEKGQELEGAAAEAVSERGWHGLVDLDEGLYSGSLLRRNVLFTAVDEQARIIADRLKRSPLPVNEIVGRKGIFGEVGWQIKKDKGELSVIKKDEAGQTVDQRGVIFKPLDIDYAKQFHNDFHYIHTPRGNRAYGFYLEQDEVPFSVLTTQPVDRPYKRNSLLLFGFDPRHCLDFTRLYSRPGVPKNVSSAMFGETFSFLRQNEPSVEAAITAFMPTYASGLSMLTGGFETPFLTKPGVHHFSSTEVGGVIAYEHLTKRRQFGEEQLVASQFPLLPVIELIAPLKDPRFEPVLKLKQDMVEL